MLTLSKNKVLRTTLDLLAVSFLVAYEAIWWPLKIAFAWVKWIIYLGFCMTVTCKCSYPRASSQLQSYGALCQWQQPKSSLVWTRKHLFSYLHTIILFNVTESIYIHYIQSYINIVINKIMQWISTHYVYIFVFIRRCLRRRGSLYNATV